MERLTDGQAAESAGLDALAAQAHELELGALPPGERPPTPEQAAANTAGELLAALTMAKMLIAPGMAWFDDFDSTWSDATLQAISQSGAAVLDLHGISVSGVFERWGPYIALAGATLPPAMVTYRAIKLRTIEDARPARGQADHERAEQASN